MRWPATAANEEREPDTGPHAWETPRVERIILLVHQVDTQTAGTRHQLIRIAGHLLALAILRDYAITYLLPSIADGHGIRDCCVPMPAL